MTKLGRTDPELQKEMRTERWNVAIAEILSQLSESQLWQGMIVCGPRVAAETVVIGGPTSVGLRLELCFDVAAEAGILWAAVGRRNAEWQIAFARYVHAGHLVATYR
jgi:hypothetical protein